MNILSIKTYFFIKYTFDRTFIGGDNYIYYTYFMLYFMINN